MTDTPTIKIFMFDHGTKEVDENLTKEELLEVIEYLARENERQSLRAEQALRMMSWRSARVDRVREASSWEFLKITVVICAFAVMAAALVLCGW